MIASNPEDDLYGAMKAIANRWHDGKRGIFGSPCPHVYFAIRLTCDVIFQKAAQQQVVGNSKSDEEKEPCLR